LGDEVVGSFSEEYAMVLIDSRHFLGNFLVSGDAVEGLPKQEVMAFQKDISCKGDLA
jgi:hypothetical protein